MSPLMINNVGISDAYTQQNIHFLSEKVTGHAKRSFPAQEGETLLNLPSRNIYNSSSIHILLFP